MASLKQANALDIVKVKVTKEQKRRESNFVKFFNVPPFQTLTITSRLNKFDINTFTIYWNVFPGIYFV